MNKYLKEAVLWVIIVMPYVPVVYSYFEFQKEKRN